MDEFIIKKDSWHFKWMSWYVAIRDIWEPPNWRFGETGTISTEDAVKNYVSNYNQPWNFCKYWRSALLWPAGRFLLNIIPYIAVIVTLNLVGFTAAGFSVLFLVGVAAFLLLGICLAFLTVTVWKKGVKTFSGAVTAAEQTSLFVAVYSSYKKKFCPAIKYEIK